MQARPVVGCYALPVWVRRLDPLELAVSRQPIVAFDYR